MAHSFQLTQGCLQAAYGETQAAPTSYPEATVQILNIKQIQTPAGGSGGPDRWRLIISDGVHFMQAMLATQLNGYVTSQELKKYGVIKLKRYLCNTVAQKRIIIILQMEVLTPFAEYPKQGSPVGLGLSADGPAGNPHGPAQAQNTYPTPVASNSNARGPQQQQYGGSGSGFGNQQHGAGAGGYGGGGGEVPIFPIKSLNPYQNKWTIKARVINKSDVRHWENARGSGKLFSCTLVDESGEIRATGFKEAVDLFYDLLKDGKVFFISKAPIKPANKQFSKVNNEYEMTLDQQSVITECQDTGDVPKVRYTFASLSSLYEIDSNAITDVIGVIRDVGDLSEIISKTTQKPFKKRDTTIVDQSGYEVKMTLWGRQAEQFEANDNPVVAVKGVKVGDFGGRSLSLMGSSSLSVNPDIPEAHALRGWYDAEGRNAHFQTYSSGGGSSSAAGSKRDALKYISQIKDEGLGMGEKPDYFTLRGTVMFVKNENISYPACPSENCNKKVTDIGSGWRCEKCDQTWPAPSYRYIMSFTVSDHTGQIWLQGFNDIGEAMLGRTADEMAHLKDSGNQAEYDLVFAQASFKSFDFKCRAKAETYQDEAKVKTSVMSFAPIDYAGACHELDEMTKRFR
ncbi:uncharacterized protein EV422DRAFT_513990 [Fimicolochytrium jonesii]|uniref:uncharacterized protein n=1 Tax=Fimicolochytrium jonesii TaxID=1396493 RepID=UPI0022FE73FE|nr:uncharacterized protein EV422DRAFT_513990 [Fimicolochytrium jonesii]KAI8825732.1 hypothetical protein EV422DRAFT_513990 [Fimicolochytrium jonesii]